MTTEQLGHRPVIDVLHVEDCPNYPEALALVERVRAELGIDAELRTTMIGDQAAAEQARFPGSPTVRVDGRDVEPGSQPAVEISLAAGCTGTSTTSPGSRGSAGCVRRCCVQPAEPERDLSLATGEKTATVSC